jgi:hypothetical protein
MNAILRRSWFRFSLRTLLVVMTALCCWLGWESSVVRGRKALLEEIKDVPGFSITTAAAYAERYPQGKSIPDLAKIPLVRRWLGDEAIQEIWSIRHYQGFSEELLARLTKAFPEAEFRESYPEPCHPGCFPRGTLVETPLGPRAIETIEADDELVAFLSGGEQIVGRVQSVFVTDNRLWKIATTGGTLLTTETQPLCLGSRQTRPAGELQPGDMILRWQNGGLCEEEVISVSSTNRIEKVFNLVLGDSELFVAGGYLASSKPPREAIVAE